MTAGVPLATLHARERCAERLGIDPDLVEWAGVVADVLDAVEGRGTNATLLRRLPHGREEWVVRLCGHAARIVWSPHEYVPIITVLGTTARR